MELKDILVNYTEVDEAIDDLNTLVDGPVRLVPVEEVKAWALTQSGLIYTLKQKAADPDDPLVQLADIILEAIGINMPSWNMEKLTTTALIDQAVATGLLTSGQKDELMALANTQIPKWQSIGLRRQPKLWQLEEMM